MNRPTVLRLILQHCPKAADHYEDGVPQDRTIFAVGTAAHDVLHVMGEHRDHTAVDGIVQRLITEGRKGYDQEPPLPADAVFEGRDLALRWITNQGLAEPKTARYELGFGFHEDWSPAEYGEGFFNLRTDTVEATEATDEEAWGVKGLVAGDYKSAWNASEAMLDGVQMRAQALALHLQGEALGLTEDPPEFIAVEIRALRTGQTYRREYWYDQGAEEVFEQTQRDITLLLNAHRQRPRRASPGPRCLGCPYRLGCKPAREWLEAFSPHGADPERIATAYAVVHTQRDALAALAREAVSGGAIETPQGVVGYITTRKQTVAPGAAVKAWDEWTEARGVEVPDDVANVLKGFLTASNFGVTQIKRVARPLSEEKTLDGGQTYAQDSNWLVTKAQRKFGIVSISDEIGDAEAPPGDS